MTAALHDYNIYALARRADEARLEGNLWEAQALETLIDGYVEGLWSVNWVRGEPIFEALISAKDYQSKKHNNINNLEEEAP